MLKCVSCNEKATHWCSRCMKEPYCGSSCQGKHFEQHIQGCVPFYFLIGVNPKRTAGQTEEEETKAETEFLKLYAAYKRDGSKPEYIPQLEEQFGKMSAAKQQEHVEKLPCHNDNDPMSREDIADLEPDNIIYMMSNNIKWCFSLDELVSYVNTFQREEEWQQLEVPRPVHPVTQQPLSEDDLRRIAEAGEIRKLNLWTKFRESQDATAVEYAIYLLLHRYGVEEYIMQGAKSTRLEKEVAGNRKADLSFILSKWPLLKVLGMRPKDVDWKNAQIPSTAKLHVLFSSIKELKKTMRDTNFPNILKKDASLVSALSLKLFNKKEDDYEKFTKMIKYHGVDFSIAFPDEGNEAYTVEIQEGESLKQAFKHKWENVDLLLAFQSLSNIWLEVSAKWQQEESDTERITELELPWPGDPYVDYNTREVILLVYIDYHPPKLDITFNVPASLENILKKPQGDEIEIEDFVRQSKEEFVKRHSDYWFSGFENVDPSLLKLKIEYLEGHDLVEIDEDAFADFEQIRYVTDVVHPIWEDVYSAVEEFIENTERFGEDEDYWTISITVMIAQDKIYKGGISYLAKNWKAYHDGLKMDYVDFAWSSFEYSEKDAVHWAKILPTVEDFTRAVVRVAVLADVFGSFPFEYSSKPAFWKAFLKGKSKTTFEKEFKKAQQKEWALLASYYIRVGGETLPVRIKKDRDLYFNFDKVFKGYLHSRFHDLSDEGSRWLTVRAQWNSAKKIEQTRGMIELPWPDDMPVFKSSHDQVVLEVTIDYTYPEIFLHPFGLREIVLDGRTLKPRFFPLFGEMTIGPRLFEHLQGNRDNIRIQAWKFSNMIHGWRWPREFDPLNYLMEINYTVSSNSDASIPEQNVRVAALQIPYILEHLHNNWFMHIVEYLNVFIDEGVFDMPIPNLRMDIHITIRKKN